MNTKLYSHPGPEDASKVPFIRMLMDRVVTQVAWKRVVALCPNQETAASELAVERGALASLRADAARLSAIPAAK